MADRAIVSVQNPVRLDDHSEPMPDFALLRPRLDRYRRATARPDEVLLLIEVAASSLTYDRLVKRALYARHEIAEFWIIDLDANAVEVDRKKSVSMLFDNRQGNSHRVAQAITAPKYMKPCRIEMQVISAHQT